MKKKLFVSFLLAATITAASAVSAFAADVRVFLDGQEVNYSSYGVYPQIIDDYTMVPIRQTAELMDINVGFDSNSSTVTLSKNGLNASHILHTNAITVNGEVKVYPTNSKIVNDYTLMPILMIADILNADVAWDGVNYFVNITLKAPAVVPATVKSAYVNSPTAYVGEEFLITVSASENTESVRLLDASGNVLSSSTSFIDFTGYRTFSLTYTPQAAMIIPLQYQVQAGNASGYSQNQSDVKYVSIQIEDPMVLVSASADKSSVTKNDTATIRVVTNDKVKNARLTDTDTNKEYSPSSSSNVSNGTEFVFKIKMTELGKNTFDVYMTNGTSYKTADKSVSITVEEKKDKLEIKDISANKDGVEVGETITFTIKTSLSTEEVEVYNENNRLIDTLVKSKESSSYRTFTADVKMESSGTNEITFKAYDNDGNKVSKSYEIASGDKIDFNSSLLKSCIVTRDGRYYVFSIYTDSYVQYVSILNDYEDELGYSTRYSTKSGNQLVWEIKITASQVEYQTITFRALDDYNIEDTYSYTMGNY